jgi:hypothetical protein
MADTRHKFQRKAIGADFRAYHISGGLRKAAVHLARMPGVGNLITLLKIRRILNEAIFRVRLISVASLK